MDIKGTLQQRFAAELPGNYVRRIIFWQDPEREFESLIDDLVLDGVKIIRHTETNNFALKQLLSKDDTESNIMVYDPVSYDDIRENWLLDIELYSEIFRADLVSMRMQELNIPDRPDLRQAVKNYSKFFGSKERLAKLAAYQSDYSTSPIQLHLDVLAVLSGADHNNSQSILRALLSDELEEDDNAVLTNIQKFGSETVLWKIIQMLTGYTHKEGNSLINLAAHVLLSGLSVTMPAAALKGLEQFISEQHKEICYAIVNEWLHTGKDADRVEVYYELALRVETHLGLTELFDKQDVSALWDSEVFPCLDECILRRFMSEISVDVVRVDAILETVEKRRTTCWYDRFACFYEGLRQVAQMQRFCQVNAAAFHIGSHKAFWKAYCENFFRMDQYYRLFHRAFGKNLKEASTSLDDLFRNTADYAERLYKNNYLPALSTQWQMLTKEEFSSSARLSEIPHQEEFYMNFVQRITDAGQRVFVIISDGLRYEVAEELTEQLQRDTKGTAELSAVQAVFPSTTPYGMAALLPHEKLELRENGGVCCDGNPTDGTENREKILKKYHPGNAAFTSIALLKMNQKSRREAIAEARCVYIYHNTIDAIGDAQSTENRVFDACEDAIQELKKLVKMITNELNGTNIFITADHGFLYTYQPLEAWDKTEKGKVTGNVISIGHRYVIGKPDCRADQMQRIPLNYLRSDFIGYTPPANVRIATGSGGMNYVHGGVSLQECVVPVIEFKNKRPGSKNYVEKTKAPLQLLSQTRKISNTMFSLNFYQMEPAVGKVSPAIYEIYLINAAGAVISDKQTVIADKTTENNKDRTFRVRFTMKGLSFSNTETYYLVIRDKETGIVAERTEFAVDIAFTDDFGL